MRQIFESVWIWVNYIACSIVECFWSNRFEDNAKVILYVEKKKLLSAFNKQTVQQHTKSIDVTERPQAISNLL